MLSCRQKVNFVGRYRIVQLEQSCPNFYPSTDCRLSRRSSNEDGKAGSEAARRIPLTRGKFALVDSADYYRLAKFQWYANGTTQNKFYAIRNHGRKGLKMHRVIMNAPDHLSVDHIDHNGLNNCKSNLRLCTHAQNSCNIGCYKGTVSKYKGVCWYKNIKKWSAAIKCDGKQYYLGTFASEIDAARAYDKKAAELHGEFACLNFPPEKSI